MMEIHKIIYCEIDFLNALFERLNRTYSPLDDDWEEGNCARKILKDVMCQECIIVHLDDKQKFDKLFAENEYFRAMVKRMESTKGYAKLDCDDFISLEAENASLNAMYFMTSGEELASKKGIFIITPKTLNNVLLYKDFGNGDIKRWKPLTWSVLLKNAKHNCNALIAVDNYLYKGRENNLFPIFDSLLPQSLPKSVSFQIALFMQEELGCSLERTHKQIIDYLKEIRPELSIDLTIYKCYTAEFHDRAIITNNMWIGCEGGLDLLKKDKYGLRTISTKTTKTHITYPFFHKDWSIDSYALLLEDVENVRKVEREYIGSDQNRLFD